MKTLALIAALSLALCAVLWLWWSERADRVEAQAEAALYARQAAQARIAEAIARDLLDDEQDRAADLAEALTKIYGGPDAPLPDHLRELLRPDGL